MSASTAASSTPSAASSAKTAARPAKSRVVVLKLAAASLAKFPSSLPARKASRSKSSSSSSSSSSPSSSSHAVAEPSPSNQSPEAASTPAASAAAGDGNTLAPPPAANGVKRKGIPGPKPGSKRGLQLGADGLPKPRGKPGPKKKPRLGEPGYDPATYKGPFAGVAPLTQKLGPKANQGAINAGLRALDRSGKPCRKWERKPFQLKSFTGVVWELPTWRTPNKANVDLNGDVKSDTTGPSEPKLVNGSSAVASEKSNSGGDVDMTTPNAVGKMELTSSPAPVAAA